MKNINKWWPTDAVAWLIYDETLMVTFNHINMTITTTILAATPIPAIYIVYNKTTNNIIHSSPHPTTTTTITTTTTTTTVQPAYNNTVYISTQWYYDTTFQRQCQKRCSLPRFVWVCVFSHQIWNDGGWTFFPTRMHTNFVFFHQPMSTPTNNNKQQTTYFVWGQLDKSSHPIPCNYPVVTV